MTSEQTHRAVLRGLFITLALLILALVLQMIALVLLTVNDDLAVDDYETVVGGSTFALITLSVVGILSLYVKTLNQKD